MTNILVGIDFGIKPEDLDPVATLAKDSGWDVHLLHVAVPEAAFGYSDVGGLGQTEVRESQSDVWTKRLDDLGESLRENGVSTTSHVLTGSIVETIIRLSEELDAGLIAIIGKHHNVVSRVLLGSVAADLIKKSERPVLVFPPAEDEPAITESEEYGRLREALRDFETNHPQVTSALNDVAYYLSGMGI